LDSKRFFIKLYGLYCKSFLSPLPSLEKKTCIPNQLFVTKKPSFYKITPHTSQIWHGNKILEKTGGWGGIYFYALKMCHPFESSKNTKGRILSKGIPEIGNHKPLNHFFMDWGCGFIGFSVYLSPMLFPTGET